ncbi:hypothetical protein GOODEAATRI_025109, partial [Goodea atripinnis]
RGTEGILRSVKPSTLVIGTKVETGAYSLPGSAAASVRYVITARKLGHIRSGRRDGAELNLPAKSSDRVVAGWGTESPFKLAPSWIMPGSSRSSAPTARRAVVADIGRPEVAEHSLSCLSRLPCSPAWMQ